MKTVLVPDRMSEKLIPPQNSSFNQKLRIGLKIEIFEWRYNTMHKPVVFLTSEREREGEGEREPEERELS